MRQAILVLNAGSSSLKFALWNVDGAALQPRIRGQLAGIGGVPRFTLSVKPNGLVAPAEVTGIASHPQAIAFVLEWLQRHGDGTSLIGAGHRVAHGGAKRRSSAPIDDALLDELDALCPLAPQHQPINLAAIRALASEMTDLPQVACFDTAFHADQPPGARLLPLPAGLRASGLQRYGFHGLSYESVVAELNLAGRGRIPPRLLVAHLGNGASLCAIRDGRSRATTMGFSTLDGLMMGTRCGSLDPGVLLYLMREHGLGETELADLLYNRCGLLGVSAISGDMRELLHSDSAAAAEAIELYCDTLVRALGSMAAVLEGVDMLVFTGGVGENAAPIRARVCRSLAWLGLDFDDAANASGSALLSKPGSRIEVRVIAADEERVIAEHTRRLVSAGF